MKSHPIKHFITVTKHRNQVIKNGFHCGIFFHCLFHDLSKFSLAEFIPSSRYYQGVNSPIREERKENNGFSFISFHHTKRNKHHWEYWCDFYRGRIIATNIPYKYIVEYYRTEGSIAFIEWFFREYKENGFKNLKKKQTKAKYEEIRALYPKTRIFDQLDHTYPV